LTRVPRTRTDQDNPEDGSRAREVEVGLEDQPDEDGLREGVEAPQDDPREGVPFWCLDDGDRQVTGGQEAHAATGSRLEVGGVPPPHVRRWSHRRLGLHRQERMLEAGRYRKFVSQNRIMSTLRPRYRLTPANLEETSEFNVQPTRWRVGVGK